MPADWSETLQLSQRNDGPEQATNARDHSIQSAKGKLRLLFKDDVFLDLFALAFEGRILFLKVA